MPKPIFVMKIDYRYDAADRQRITDEILKSDLNKEYHVITIENDTEKTEFEMYNADKIDRQEWNEIVNKIIK